MPTTHTAISGNLSDVRNAVTACTSPGDTVVIPKAGQPADGWQWNDILTINKGFNIRLIGDNGTLANRPKIFKAGGNSVADILDYTLANSSPKVTALVANLDFEGEGHHWTISGYSNIDYAPPVMTGGFRMCYCRWAYPYYLNKGTDAAYPNAAFTAPCTWSGSVLTRTDSGTFSTADLGRVVYGNAAFPVQCWIKSIGGTNKSVNLGVATTASGSGTLSFTGITSGGGPAVVNTSANLQGDLYEITGGWIVGVIDHCELENNMIRYGAARGRCNGTAGDPRQESIGNDLVGGFGDYAFWTGPITAMGRSATNGELGAGWQTMVFENNLFHFGAKGITDCSASRKGGAIITARHNTHMGSWAIHGDRESGSRQRGGRLVEAYNNHYCRPVDYQWCNGGSSNPVEPRCGELIAYNNFITAAVGQQNAGTNTRNSYLGGFTPSVVSYTFQHAAAPSPAENNFFWYAADGVNPWDLNERSNPLTDWYGFKHVPYAGYSNTVTSDATYVTGGDSVSAGIDSESRYGHVYATITGGSQSPGSSTSTITANVSFTVPTGLTTVPANYFRGFCIRAKGQRNILNNATYIRNSTASATVLPAAGTNTSVQVTFTVCDCQLTTSNATFAYNPANVFELRFIRTYFGAQGTGSFTKELTYAIDQQNTATMKDGSPIVFQDTVSGGAWQWGNMKRIATSADRENTPFTPEDPGDALNNFPDGVFALALRDCHQYSSGPATNVGTGLNAPATNGGDAGGTIQPLFDRGYPWNPNVAAATDPTHGNQATRVGADWGKDFVDPVTGQVIRSTIGPASPARTGAWGFNDGTGQPVPATGTTTPSNTANTSFATTEFASFYKPGVGGFTYPHPLVVQPSSGTAPEITVNDNFGSIWSTSLSGQTFQMTATGDPTITWSMPTPGTSEVPSWVTLSSDGILTQNATAVAGDFSFNVTAHNSTSPNDTESFTLRVTAPVSLTLTAPSNNQSFQIVSPATTVDITLTATVSGGSGTVDFYYIASPATPTTEPDTLIASDSTSPYSISWTAVPAGTFNVMAKLSTAKSNINQITVIAASAVLDAPNIVVSG